MTTIKVGFTLALLAALTSLACRPLADETSIVVHVESDGTLSLERVDMTARRVAGGGASATGPEIMKSMTFSDPANVTWVLYPTGADKSFAIQIEATGRKGDLATISQQALIAFEKGQRQEITMSLDDACLKATCSPLTCEHGACIDPMFVGRPGHPAGGEDARPVEPTATDGGVDRKDGASSPDVPQGNKALGDTCTANADCASTHCTDGVCCNETCGGSCQQCNNAGTMRGYCQAVTAGQPAANGHPACAPAEASTCKQTGTCDGKGACALFADGTICKAAACDATANNLTESRCDGMGTCKPGTPITCAPFRCKAGQTACARTCAANADCDGQPCINLSCGKLKVGAVCSTDTDCELGFCTDGVCCDVRCAGQCQACNLSSSVGTCSNLRSGQPGAGKTACTGSGTCGGSCTGQASCGYPDSAVSCRPASCDVSTLTAMASCNGAGACPAVSTSPCPGQLRCRAGTATCLTQCATSADCLAGFYCAGTACAATKGNGMVCATGAECATGQCVDGRCCNSACNAACQTCATGMCGVVTNAEDTGTCADTMICSATGTCGKKNGQTCTAGTECATGQCVDGHCCNSACTGTCQTCATGTCSPLINADDPGTCTGTMTCNGQGSCVSKQGQVCTVAGECANGMCVDGRCCNTACTGSCQTCVTGTCSPVTGGDDVGTCTGTMTCNASGVCTKKTGQTCTTTAECASGQCVDGRCCDTACTGSCLTCATGTCSPVRSADDANTCTGTMTCNASGVCTRKNGQTCTGTADCSSGNCVDGHCCDTACTGSCLTCTTGTCSPVRGADDANTCTGAMTCNASGVCTKKLGQTCTAGTECVAGFCADGRCCDAACTGTCLTCSAAGACTPVVNGEDNTCTGANTCNTNGVCLKKQGQVCAAGTECVTGNCVDGHCCNSACNLACQTCSTGVCSQVLNGPDVGTCSGTQTCNATGMCCTTQQTVCATRACGSAQDNCGATFTCPNTCPVLPNSILGCNVNSCSYTCAAGIFPLPCRTTTNAACGRWDFESNTVEGWSSDDASPPSASTLNPFSGTHSLRVPLTFLPNPFTLLQVPLCAQGVDLSGKRLTAHLTFVSGPGFPPISVADGVVATLEVVGPNGAFARAAEVDGVISPNQFELSGTIPAGSPPTFTTLEMFFVGDTRPWQGTVYVDDIRIEN